MDLSILTWLALGFGLGIVHAFDADHVMALSLFAARGRDAREGVRMGLRWALGHGLVLLAAGASLLWLGQALPAFWALQAERGVGLVMIGLGIWVWRELIRGGSHLHFHTHAAAAPTAEGDGDGEGFGLPPHAHWHRHEHGTTHQHEHGALIVGALHGLAGSAPILAVLPAATRSPLFGLGYLVLFALGVSVAMAGVSGLLGHVAGRARELDRDGPLRRFSPVAGLQALSASGSILAGGWLFTLA